MRNFAIAHRLLHLLRVFGVAFPCTRLRRSANVTIGFFSVLLIFPQSQPPRLAFCPIGPEQPTWVEGIPDWRDSVFVRHDTLIVRHLRERRAYTKLRATLQSSGKTLELRVEEDAGRQGHEGGVPGGLTVAAYEARIGPLSPGSYTLVLRDEGYRFALKPFRLHRVVNVTAD